MRAAYRTSRQKPRSHPGLDCPCTSGIGACACDSCLQPACQSSCLIEFLERETARIGISGTGLAQLRVTIVEMLRQLLDNLRLAYRTETESGEESVQVGLPARHDRLL